VDPYVTDWLNLIVRFVHVVTGIAWIGASFYFIWLDNHLENPPEWKKEKGIKGDLWAIHGGGFYEVAKYELAPPVLPDILHWFKWEAYSTWISGFYLLALMYYVGAETYLIDTRVADISQWQAIGIGLGVIFGSWIIYDLLCRSPLAKSALFLGLGLLAFVALLAFGLSQVFSPRGAYMHVGAVIGTIMAGNVYSVIIPSQKALVDAVEAGGKPDPAWAAKAKLVSTHNTYLTLPVIFIMISSHYPMTYNHEFSWAILIALIIITALARHYFVLRHKNNHQPLLMAGVIGATLVLAYVIAPTRDKIEAASPVAFDPSLSVDSIIKQRCATCHSATPTDEVFRIAPSGVILDTPDDIERWARRIIVRTVVNKDMPMINKTDMTDEERRYLNEKLGK